MSELTPEQRAALEAADLQDCPDVSGSWAYADGHHCIPEYHAALLADALIARKRTCRWTYSEWAEVNYLPDGLAKPLVRAIKLAIREARTGVAARRG